MQLWGAVNRGGESLGGEFIFTWREVFSTCRENFGGNFLAGTKRRERDILFGGVFFLAGTWTVPS